MWMDSRIWSRLPPPLLDRIIIFLPPHCYFKLRSVSKRWYSLLFSPPFLHLHLLLSPLHPSFIFFLKHPPLNHPQQQACVFDPEALQWRRLPAPLLPPGFAPAASSGGLVCFISTNPGQKTLLLTNPLTGTLTCLPPTPTPRLFPSVGLHKDSTSLQLVVAGDDLISPYSVKNLSSESYINGGWGEGGRAGLPRLCSMESGVMVYEKREGRFYAMSSSPYSVVRYEVGGRVWGEMQVPMRRFLRWPGLVECGGRVLLVAGVEKSRLSVPKSVRVWVREGEGWEEVERMPSELYKVFEEVEEGEGGRGFYCVGSGEYVLLVIRGGLGMMVVLNLRGGRWAWGPPCPFYCRSGCGGVEGGAEVECFSYQERMSTGEGDFLDRLSFSSV